MEKNKKDSWVDTATGNKNFFGRKTVDKSTSYLLIRKSFLE